MALSESGHSGATVRRVESLSSADTVRHVDQLSDEELATLLPDIDGASAGTVQLDDQVIVFTDYLRVE